MRITHSISVLGAGIVLMASSGFGQDAAPATPVQPEALTSVIGKSQEEVIGQPGVMQDKRIFGVLPNYRTAEGSVPYSPITVKQKFMIATKDTLSYPSYILGGAFAGLSQLTNSNPSFGQGLVGYAKRYGTNTADQVIGNYMTEAIMPTILREDPRYFRKGHGTGWGRVGYALSRIMVTRTDSGGTRFNFSEWVGNGSVATLGNLYYPDAKGVSATLQRTGSQVGTDAISDILKEFWPDVKRKWFHKDTASSNGL